MKKKQFIGMMMAMVLGLSTAAGVMAAAQEVEPVEIEMWFQESSEDDLDFQKLVLEHYNEQHPEAPLKVKWVLGGDASAYVQKMLMAAATDTLPAVFMGTCGNIMGIPESGVMRDITEYVDGDEEWISRYTADAFSAQYEYTDGVKYGIPGHAEVQGWYMNKRLFDEQGLEIPTTWDEWIDCIETFKKAGIIPIAYGAADTWSRWGFDLFFDRYGFVDHKEALLNKEMKFSEFCLPAYERIDQLAKLGAFPENVTTATNTEAVELFKGGKAAILTSGSWSVNGLQESPDADNFVFTWGPEFEDSSYNQKVATKTCSWTYWVGKKATEDEATLKAVLGWLKALSDEEMITYYVEEKGGFPACYYHGDTSQLSSLYNSMLEKCSDEYTGYGEMSSYIDPSFEAVYWNTVSAVITQTATPEEAAEQLDQAMELIQ